MSASLPEQLAREAASVVLWRTATNDMNVPDEDQWATLTFATFYARMAAAVRAALDEAAKVAYACCEYACETKDDGEPCDTCRVAAAIEALK